MRLGVSNNVTSFGYSAFPSSDAFTIYCGAGSFAESCAKQDSIPYVIETDLFACKVSTAYTSITYNSEGISAAWTKNTAATGCRITYSKDKSFKTDVHSYTVSNNTTTSANFSSRPKSGETWYVKYRCYVTVGGTKYYGTYSGVKSVKTK